jgi:hypothetical protein
MFSQRIPNLLAVILKEAEARSHLNRTDKCGEAQRRERVIECFYYGQADHTLSTVR